MALSLPALNVGDVIKDWANTVTTKMAAYANAIPGTAINTGSIPINRLEAKKAWFPVSLHHDGDLVADLASNDIVWIFTLPNVAGAVNSTWRFHGSSFGVPNRTAATLTKAAGTRMEIRKNGVSKQTVLLDAAGLTTTTPLVTMLGTSESSSSADVWDVLFTDAGGLYVDPTLILFWSLDLTGT